MSAHIPVEGLTVLPSRHSVPETLSRLETLAREKGMTLFAHIDFSGDAARVGLTQRPTGLAILGNPKGGTPLMLATPSVAIDLPLKVLAWEDEAGQCWVGFNQPEYLQKRHGFAPALMQNIAALANLVAAAAD